MTSENLVDRIVKYFDPVRARDRARSRMMMALAGGYVGASRTRRSMISWNPMGNDPDSDTILDLPTLRARSRDLLRNTPLATGAINTNCSSVVGTGLKLQCRIDRDMVNMTEEQADAWEAGTEREWRLFSESPECDVARTLPFSGLQELAFRSALESGDVFAVLPYILRNGSPYGTKVQLVEADRVCNQGNKADTDTLVGGVEKDGNGAPVTYHILKQHPGRVLGPRAFEWVLVPAFGAKTGRRNVIHLYRVLRPGQTRGVPYLAPVIEPLKQLDRYTEAELMASVVAAMFTVFVKSEEGDGEISPFAPTAETGGSTSDDDYKLGNGAIVGLAPGEDISTANPGRPNNSFDPFVMSILRQVGVALELPFEVLIKHFTASYSAARAALLEAWRFFGARRYWLAQSFCRPVYETWLDEAVAIGRIKAPGYFTDPILRQAYLGAQWIGDAAGQIDPVKEITAAEKRIALGISTVAEETAGITGGDFEKNIPQIRKERRLLKEAGLMAIPAATSAGNGTDAAPAPPDETGMPERRVPN